MQAVTRANTSTRSARQAISAHHEQPQPATVQAPEAVISGEDSEEEPVETYFELHDPLVEDVEETTHPTGNSFTPAQLATIESTVQFSVDRALQSGGRRGDNASHSEFHYPCCSERCYISTIQNASRNQS